MKELEAVRKDYGDERRTQILDETAELQLEDLIADEQVAVTVSHSGYLKRTPISTYRQQRRGGTGRLGMRTREEDFVSQLIVDSTHAYLLCFTNKGRVYWLKVYEIPDVGAAGKGKSIASLLSLQPGETVRTILPVRNLEEEGKFIFFATRKGTVKKTPLKDFSNVMARGIIAIGIDDDDELVAVRITDGNQIVFLATHDGMAIRFEEGDVRSMGRPAYGVRGIDLGKNDYVVGMAVTPKQKNGAHATASSLSPKPASASALTSRNTGSRLAAAKASSTSRPPPATAKSSASSSSTRPRRSSSSASTARSSASTPTTDPRSRPLHARRQAAQPRRGRRVAAAVVIPPEEAKIEPETGTLLQ